MPKGGATGQNLGHLKTVTVAQWSYSEGQHDLVFTLKLFCLIS